MQNVVQRIQIRGVNYTSLYKKLAMQSPKTLSLITKTHEHLCCCLFNAHQHTSIMKALLLLAITTLTSFSVYAQNDSYIRFEIRNAGVNVEGMFTEYETDIDIDPKDLSNATFKGTISVESIDTGIRKRDKDLKKKSYFDIDNYPEISFELTSIKAKSEGGGYDVKGNITIKDVTKSVSFDAIKVRVSDELYIKGELTLNRRDFNVGGSSIMLSDELKASFRLPTKN